MQHSVKNKCLEESVIDLFFLSFFIYLTKVSYRMGFIFVERGGKGREREQTLIVMYKRKPDNDECCSDTQKKRTRNIVNESLTVPGLIVLETTYVFLLFLFFSLCFDFICLLQNELTEEEEKKEGKLIICKKNPKVRSHKKKKKNIHRCIRRVKSLSTRCTSFSCTKGTGKNRADEVCTEQQQQCARIKKIH